jgi:ElaB/YqjD/DUF883 family membrane-anchored ribosome-binding protein
MSAADEGSARTGEEQSSRDPAQIREEIEETRGELGETVAAVAEKTDVKQQAQAKADELKSQAAEKAEEAQQLAQENPVPLAIGAAFLVGVVVGRLLSR